jgi:hypothetical protein
VTLFARQHAAREGPSSFVDAPVIATGDLTDFLLLDITPESYESIGEELCIQRWEPAAHGVTFPIFGTLWGPNKRVMVPLQCRSGKRVSPIVVHMLLDTGAPVSLLCAKTFEHLGFRDALPRAAKVELHGCTTEVSVAHSHFVDNDVLGADWLSAARARVYIDYAALRVTVHGSSASALVDGLHVPSDSALDSVAAL